MKIFKQRMVAAVAMTFWMAIALQAWSQGNAANPMGAGSTPSGNVQVTLKGEHPSQAPTVQLQAKGNDANAGMRPDPSEGTLEVADGGSVFLKSKGNQSIAASDLLKVKWEIRDKILENIALYHVARATFTLEQLHAQPHSVQDLMLSHPEIFVVQ